MNDLQMYTVFKKPDDYPEEWVVRRFSVSAEGIQKAHEIVYKTDKGRDDVRSWKVQSPECSHTVITMRHPDDDPNIVETWI